MNVRGGDIRQLTINGREFGVAAESSVNIQVGGFSNTTALNGNGSLHVTQRRQPGGFTDCNVSIDDTGQELEFLQDLSNSGAAAPVTMTLVSGITYSGSLAVTGDLMKNTGDGVVTLEMRGSAFDQI